MTALSIQGISKRFGPNQVLREVSLTISSGDFFFILGPSGCGKSTLLRIIAGLDHQDAGSITADGRSITEIPAHQRGIGMVFQQYALWPHMTVAQNISFGLEVQRIPRPEREQRVQEALELVRMNDLGGRYPHQISGGQQQRVALARALAVRPRIILLDEPLSNLDARLREEIRHELQELHRSLNVTMIYVTHDQEDALTLATKIALLRDGTVEQVGTPQELYQTPHTRYVADFLGSANILKCQIESSTEGDRATVVMSGSVRCEARAPLSTISGATRSGAARNEAAYLCVRPESVEIIERSDPLQPGIPATVQHVAYKGAHLDIECDTVGGERILSRVLSTRAPRNLQPGAAVFLRWDSDAAVIVGDSPR